MLPEFPEGAARSFERVFQERTIESRTNARVVDAADGALILQVGQRVSFDAVLWATQAAPTPLLRDSGLAVDARGFLKVTPTLQTSDTAIFGTGDCVDFEAYPTLQKNGVHAVRQGDVLFDNISAFPRATLRVRTSTLLSVPDEYRRWRCAVELWPFTEGPLGSQMERPHRPPLDYHTHPSPTAERSGG